MQNLKVKIKRNSNITIQQQLINYITQAISNHQLEQGESLPSINKISAELKISRDTIFKAYQKLKEIDLVDSTAAKGYFVSRKHKRILLLLDYFSPFKETLHNSFKKNIPEKYTVDLVFHHYNIKLFKSIIQQSTGNYDIFIIMNPDTVTFRFHPVLKRIDPSKLLLIDVPVNNWSGVSSERYATVSQNFDQVVYDQLKSIINKIKKYSSFNLVNSLNLYHPSETVEYFIRFCYDHDIECKIFEQFNTNDIENNQVYFILNQSDLSMLLGICKEKNLVPGKDIGILAYNDSPLYKFIGNGISVISSDFKLMGEKAADFVKTKKICKEIIPTKIKSRGSL